MRVRELPEATKEAEWQPGGPHGSRGKRVLQRKGKLKIEQVARDLWCMLIHEGKMLKEYPS